jgi:hypothetical protein
MTSELNKQLYCPLENTKHEMYCKNTSSDPKFRPVGELCQHAAHCYELKTKLDSYDIEKRH